MKTLDEIGLETNTDKVGHGYYEHYQRMFGPLRDAKVTIMEHGILGGDSIEVWSRFFTHAESRIFGVDIHDRGYRPSDPRVHLRFGSNADAMFMSGVYAESGPLTACIEDASHFASHQIGAFNIGWSAVAPGGVWCTEDLHVCHSPQHRDHTMTFIDYIGVIASEMQDPAGATGCAAFNPEHPWSEIDSIVIHKGLSVIRKRA